MRGTKEFYEMQEMFERSMSDNSIYGFNFDKPSKEEKNPVHIFYNDGFTNQMFHGFMSGYSCGKLAERQ